MFNSPLLSGCPSSIPGKPVSPDWFRYASPADMPREFVTDFFEGALDTGAEHENAFLRFIAARSLILLVNLDVRDYVLVRGDRDDPCFGIPLTSVENGALCESFWDTLDAREAE